MTARHVFCMQLDHNLPRNNACKIQHCWSLYWYKLLTYSSCKSHHTNSSIWRKVDIINSPQNVLIFTCLNYCFIYLFIYSFIHLLWHYTGGYTLASQHEALGLIPKGFMWDLCYRVVMRKVFGFPFCSLFHHSSTLNHHYSLKFAITLIREHSFTFSIF
jgi:hypothetical protein